MGPQQFPPDGLEFIKVTESERVPPGPSEHDIVSLPVGPPVEMVGLGDEGLLHVLLRADHHAVVDAELDAKYRTENLKFSRLVFFFDELIFLYLLEPRKHLEGILLVGRHQVKRSNDGPWFGTWGNSLGETFKRGWAILDVDQHQCQENREQD